MPKSGDNWPIVPVFVGQITDIPFEFTIYGIDHDPSSGTAEIRATLNGVIKFTKAMDLTAVPFLPKEDLFDEIGDWPAIVKFIDGEGTFYSEQFYFRVMKAGEL